MKLVVSVAIACAIVLATIFIGLARVSADPSTEQLNADLAAIHVEIERAESDRAAFSGGAIVNLFTARIEILRTTVAMLEQKRSSILRRIDLVYLVDGARSEPDSERVSAIRSDLAAANLERDRQQSEANRYSGGLIQTIALMNAATSEITISQLTQVMLAEQYGFNFSFQTSASGPARPIGQNIVDNDGDAL